MKKKAKSDFGTKNVPQQARYIKSGYYTVDELAEMLEDLRLHVRIYGSTTEVAVILGGGE